MFLPVFVCLLVCMSVSKNTQNACMDLDEMLRVDRCRDMDELTFEPNPDYSLDARTGLLSPILYKHWYVEFYVGKIPHMCIGVARCCSDMWF